jgi:hypothetical protein
MSLFDRFREGLGVQRPISPESVEASADDQAIARYRYMLKTAPPEVIEQAHAEAFAKLTPEQRRRVLDELSNEVPEGERAAVVRAGDSPEQLARVATRSEIRQPGVLERIFGGVGGVPGSAGPGLGTFFAGSFLSSMAGTVLGSVIAQHFFNAHPEASHLFGDSTPDLDPSTHASDAQHAAIDDANTTSDDAAPSDDSGFDGGDTWDV